MPLSRRLRFEVLRRDGHTCRYCGGAAPDASLTVDHVIPTTLGGGDEPSNLVTACTDCNAGKASIAPDSPIVEDVDAAALLWAKAMERAADARRAETRWIEEVLAWFDRTWIICGDLPRSDTWHVSIERFLAAGLSPEDLNHRINVTMTSNASPANFWRYFCGCCWNELTRRQELARRYLEDEEV